MIDFTRLTPEERLALIETTLGLMPSGSDWKERAIYFCFQVAGNPQPERVQDALDRLNAARPGWFEDHVRPFAKDIHGLSLPEEAVHA